MGYGMKYTQGGFPFKEIETGTDRVSPVSPSPNLLKAGPEVGKFDVDDLIGNEVDPIENKVDPDAPGTPGTLGYEPPVKRSDLDTKGKKLYDSKTDYFISNLHKDTKISLKKKKKISNEQDNKELDKHEDAMGY